MRPYSKTVPILVPGLRSRNGYAHPGRTPPYVAHHADESPSRYGVHNGAFGAGGGMRRALPSSAQFWQSVDLSSQTVEQTPHEAGHSWNMCCGLKRHSSRSAQIAHACAHAIAADGQGKRICTIVMARGVDVNFERCVDYGQRESL
eukprot:6194450-Pleurochrysis_carterae.AAC.2